jgi:hypothetical protein
MRFWGSFRAAGIIAILAVAALPCFAGEVAVLKNGFSIRHERREIVGDVTRLYTSADGSSFVDVPTAEIEHFEAAPEVPASGFRNLTLRKKREGWGTQCVLVRTNAVWFGAWISCAAASGFE